jgi:hypothetical protein
MSREAHVRFWEGVGVKPPRHSLRGAERRAPASSAAKLPIYYHGCRTHLSLEKDAPESRPVEHPEQGSIVEIPMVGGLHHRYTHQAA